MLIELADNHQLSKRLDDLTAEIAGVCEWLMQVSAIVEAANDQPLSHEDRRTLQAMGCDRYNARMLTETIQLAGELGELVTRWSEGVRNGDKHAVSEIHEIERTLSQQIARAGSACRLALGIDWFMTANDRKTEAAARVPAPLRDPELLAEDRAATALSDSTCEVIAFPGAKRS